jgi:hypothetical protein
MTTQQPEEAAVGGEAPPVELSPEDRLNAAFEDLENHKEEELPEEEQPSSEDEPQIEEEEEELPPIEPPVSWDADAKAVFASLPREAQEIVTKREAERERFVQQKSQEAARAKQEVEQQAYQSLAQYEQQVAAQLSQYAQLLSVPEPDMSLLATDPQTYAFQAKQYQDAQAQQRQLQHQAQQYAEQARQREAYAQHAYAEEQKQILADNLPEYLDPTSGPKLQQELSAVARELGYPPELIGQARATDIIAMKQVRDLKVKADKYDQLMAKKMEGVRAAKGKPPVTARPGTAQAPGAARQNQYASDREALRKGDQAATQRVLDSFFTKPK